MSEEMFFTVLAILLGSVAGRSIAYWVTHSKAFREEEKLD